MNGQPTHLEYEIIDAAGEKWTVTVDIRKAK